MKKILGISMAFLFVVSFPSAGFAKDYNGKKILFVDSYHKAMPGVMVSPRGFKRPWMGPVWNLRFSEWTPRELRGRLQERGRGES